MVFGGVVAKSGAKGIISGGVHADNDILPNYKYNLKRLYSGL